MVSATASSRAAFSFSCGVCGEPAGNGCPTSHSSKAWICVAWIPGNVTSARKRGKAVATRDFSFPSGPLVKSGSPMTVMADILLDPPV